MATATLDVSSVLAATGWSGATVANLTTSNDVRATDGVAGELIRGEFTNAPGDFSSMSQIQIAVEARVVGTVSRAKTLRIELLDSADNVLETTDNPNSLTSGDVNYFSAPWSRTDSKSAVDGYRWRVTVLEGGGMGDSATVEIDRISATLTYTPTETRTGDAAITTPLPTLSAAGTVIQVLGSGAITAPVPALNAAGVKGSWTSWATAGTVNDPSADWSGDTPANLATDNGVFASYGPVTDGSISGQLRLTNFGFSLPAGATIGDVEVEYRIGATLQSVVETLHLTKNGTSQQSSDLSPINQFVTETLFTVKSEGSTAFDDTAWGMALTKAEVEATTFGVIMTVNPEVVTYSHRLAPNSIRSQGGWSGTPLVTQIDEDPASPDTSRWLTTGATNGLAVVDFPTPPDPLHPGTDLQVAEFSFRRTTGNSAENTPCTLEIYENDVLRATLMNSVNISNTINTDRYVSRTWNANILSDPTGAGLQLLVLLGPTTSTGSYSNLNAMGFQLTLADQTTINLDQVRMRVQYQEDTGGTVTGSGGVTAPVPTISASGERVVTGSAAISAPVPTIAASGERVVTGDAAILTPVPAISASGERVVTGDAAILTPVPTISASGERVVTGSAAITAPVPTIAASGERIVPGDAAITAPLPIIVATGERVVPGDAVIAAPLPTISGTGTIEGAVTGTAAINTPVPAITASGDRVVPGSGAISTTLPLLSGSGSIAGAISGDAAITTPVPTISGSGDRVVNGSAAIDAPVPAISGSGTVTSTIDGSAAIDAPLPALSGTGTLTGNITGDGAIDTPLPALSGAGGVVLQGSAAITAPVPTINGAGTVGILPVYDTETDGQPALGVTLTGVPALAVTLTAAPARADPVAIPARSETVYGTPH